MKGNLSCMVDVSTPVLFETEEDYHIADEMFGDDKLRLVQQLNFLI